MTRPETAPRRIQRRRVKGWRLPQNAVYVGRPTIWGNPFGSTPWGVACNPCQVYFFVHSTDDPAEAFRLWLTKQLIQAEVSFFMDLRWKRDRILARLPELRGKHLACWCPENQPGCHADVLLELANS